LHAHYQRGSSTWGWVLVGTSPVTWYASLMAMKGLNGGEPVSGGQVVLGTGIALTQLVLGVVLLAMPSVHSSPIVAP